MCICMHMHMCEKTLLCTHCLYVLIPQEQALKQSFEETTRWKDYKQTTLGQRSWKEQEPQQVECPPWTVSDEEKMIKDEHGDVDDPKVAHNLT